MRLGYLLLCFFTAPVLAATIPVQKEFRDWVVTCDNLRHCVAEGADNDNPTLVVRLSRDAGPEGATAMTLYGITGDSKFTMLRLDGKPLPLAAKDWYSDGTDDDMSFQTDSPTEIQKLVTAMRNGSRLSLGDATASLNGLSAALLLVDDVQGRIDNDSAWIRRGGKPATAVPAVPPAPIVVARPHHGAPLSKAEKKAVFEAALALSKSADFDCDAEASDMQNAQIARLSEHDALVLVECSRGAYQSSYDVYRVPVAQPAQAKMVALPTVPGEKPLESVTSAKFDPATGSLSHFAKGRGIGDCGESAEWLFDGRQFVLKQMSREIRCPGVLIDFPSLWRSR